MSPLCLRKLTPADLPFADSLRALAGWNQTMADWKRFLEWEPDGCLAAEWNGVLAGTATTTVYGPDLAWIGMMLVHPDFRRRGIGRAMLSRCIELLRARGVRCIKLDATPLGKKVYDGLGFQDEWTLTRWERAPTDSRAPKHDSRIRDFREADLDQIETLDTGAFGVSRRRIVADLAAQCQRALVLESNPGRIDGYGLLRHGSNAHYLGPVVAVSPEIGCRLVEALVEEGKSGKIFWDIPDANAAAVTWARRNGFGAQRQLTRMFLGENVPPGNPQQQFAIAAPEIG